MTPAELFAWKQHEITGGCHANRWFKLFFRLAMMKKPLFVSWLTGSQWCSSTGRCQQPKRRHHRGDGSSGIRVAGARKWAGVPPSEPRKGGGLGMAERTWTLEALHRSSLPPYRKRAEGGCPGKCSSRAGGCSALSLHHRPAVHAPVSTRHR